MTPSCGYCLDSDCHGFGGFIDPLCPEHGTAQFRRSCNRHGDCDAADLAILKSSKGKWKAVSHCHNDECPECFGY